VYEPKYQLVLTRRDDWSEELVGYYNSILESKVAAEFFLITFPGAYLRGLVRPVLVEMPDNTKAA